VTSNITSDPGRLGRRTAVWLWLTLLVIGTISVVLFLVHFRYHAWDFRNNLWGPARLLLQGEMPYDSQALEGLASEWGVPFHLSIWFPTILGIGLPLAAVPLPNAANIWFFLSLVAFLVTAGLVHRVCKSEDSPRALLLLALTVILFAPLYAHLGQGQASLIVLASVIASWVLLEQDRPGWAGLVLSVSWVKPQLVLFAWPVLVWLAIEKGRLRHVFVGWLAGSLAQTIPLWILEPTWPSGYLGALGANPVWLQPNIHSLVTYWSRSQVLSWTVTLLAVVAGAVWLVHLWRRRSRIVVLAWALALTPMLSPYTWSYDQVLLLPFVIVAMRMANPGYRRAIFWIALFGCQAVYIMLRSQVYQDAWYAWFPPVLMLLGAWLTCPQDEPGPRP
jgi:hypothetical protein